MSIASRTAALGILLAATALVAPAQEAVRFVNSMALSPDGQQIAISWRGDIWVVGSQGGTIRRLTTDPGTDSQPAFSPDGQSLAFVSNRSGSNQIWVVPTTGGVPERKTLNTDGYRLVSWLSDGQHFLVEASRDHFWRRSTRFFVQSLDGTRAPELLFDDYGATGSLSQDDRHLLFTRESAPTWRKNYYGAQSSQVWHFDREKKAFAELNRDHGGSRWPLWGGDGSTYYYVNQTGGAWNLHRASIVTDEDSALTSFKEDGVMFPVASRDGSTIVFMRLFELWRYDTTTDQMAKLDITYEGDPLVAAKSKVDFDSSTSTAITGDGMEVAFTAGGDVWVMDTELREPVRVTSGAEEEREALWSKDYQTLYFISDMGGNPDIWMATRADPEKYWWQSERFVLKKLTDDAAPESRLRLHADGERIAYHRHASVWSIKTDGTENKELINSWDPPSYDFSPDGKWIVYSVQDADFNDDVWIKPLDGSREPYNVSCHPDDDRNPVWSADGKFIAFTGRRWGQESDLVWVALAKETLEKTSRQKKLEKALEKMKKRKGKKKPAKPELKSTVQASKKSDELDIPVHPLAGTWRGTSRGGMLPAGGLPFEMELAIDAKGKLTGSATSAMGSLMALSYAYNAGSGDFEIVFDDNGVQFMVSGKLEGEKASGAWTAMAMEGTWEATRVAKPKPTDAVIAKAKSEEKKKAKIEPVEIDFEGLRDRLRRVSIRDSRESSLVFAPKGAKLFFQAQISGRRGTYTIDLPDSVSPKSSKASITPGGTWLEDGKSYATNRSRPTVLTTSGGTTSYTFKAFAERDIGAHHAAIFDQAWRTMRDRWYDENLGNNDWDAIREKYLPFARATRTAAELGIVSNAMLGELNGSHLGFRKRGGNPIVASANRSDEWREVTGHLGARIDPTFEGPGLKIKDVIDNTPAAREDSRLHPGEIITTVDGRKVDASMDPATYLTGRSGRQVTIEVLNAEGERRELSIVPTSSSSVRRQLYEHWLEQNRAMVDKQSNGRFGYVHIRGMGGGNLLTFDTEIYRVGHGKDGLVIDVRENGGGSITDHLLTILCQPSHAITRPRGGGTGYPQDRRIYATWSKPIVVLCNQNSFSNAEIFSHAIKTLKRGRVVGVPTAGGVISTGGASLYDGGFVRMPFRGWYTLDGEDMELNGCMPHFVIWPQPGEMPAGIDRQLEKAVQVLDEDVKAYKARPRPVLRKATERTGN